MNIISVTSHKVEVNAGFSDFHRPENMVEGTQKMFTPQLYEKLRAWAGVFYEKKQRT